MTVAYQGVPGAFGYEACLRFVPEHEPVPLPTFEAVVAAVAAGRTDLGMLPLANNEAGETGARALIDDAPVRVIDEPVLPIRMHLLGLPGTSSAEIETVVSHPVALRQCARTLAIMGVKLEEALNTAIAAAELSERSRAVLGSEWAARIYGLAILERDVHDRPENATRFAVLARGER